MAQWGTPEYAAEQHRQQQMKDAQFRQQQEQNKRFADGIAAREAEQARQKAAHSRNEAFSAGLNGDVHSTSKYTNYSSYLSGAAAGMRDPHTGKSFLSRSDVPQVSSTATRSSTGNAVGVVFVATVFLAALLGFVAQSQNSGVSASSSNRANSAVVLEPKKQLSLKPYTHYVDASGLRVRTGPSTSYQILGTYKRGDCVRVVGQRDAWKRVVISMSGKPMVQYAYGSYLRPLTSRHRCIPA